MKKFDFSKLRGSILLMLFMMCALIGFSQGTDDFQTLPTSNSYLTNTSTGGWVVVNSAVGAPTATPTSVGTCGRQHVVMNGKTTAVGSITSPTITGGCGTLSFNYSNVFSESNGADFTVKLVNPTDATDILYDTTVVVANDDMLPIRSIKNFIAEVNVAADFVLMITNNSPSQNTGNNKDRLAIGCIEWTAYTTPEPPTPPTPVIEPTWVTCDQVGIFNTQVVGLVPTCSTVGDSTVYHFVYNSDFTQYPYQTPNQDWGADGNKIYVDVAVGRPNTDVTGVEVSFGAGTEHVVTFGNILDPNNGTLGADRYAALRYFPVATVIGGQAVGNTTEFNRTVSFKWYTGEELVAIQKLNVVVDAAPMPDMDLDSIATLPYAYNFDEGADPYFMIDNGENTNAWYVGQAQTFDNNKLYISSNNGLTNKYDVTKASNVMAYRTVLIPEAGAILSFDYRVNGQDSYDYLKVNLVKGGTTTTIATLQGENEWTSFSYDISGEMAGEVCIQFNWVNNAAAGSQFPAAIDNISVIQTPCSQPTALTAAVDSTTAVITWQAAEGQTAWNFQYKLANHSEWYTIPVTETTVTLNDLQGNSNYMMRVQAVCGENVSAWTNGAFTVACQTLESEVADVTIGTGTSSNNQFPFSGYYNHSYNQQLFTEADLAAEGIVPGTVINSLSFNYSYATSSVRPVTMWLTTSEETSLSSAFVSINEFTQVFSNTCQEFNNSNEGWNTITLDQPFTYTGGSLVLATLMNKESADDATTCFTTYSNTSRFRYTSNSGKARYYQVDGTTPITFTEEGFPKTTGSALSGTSSSYRNNIKFNVVILTCSDEVACVAPTALEVSDYTANSAVLTWTAGAEGQTNFVVEYMAEGATEWSSVEVSDTTYTLTELAQLTNYSVRVKAVCGDNNWSDVITASFRTEGVCTPVTNLETSNISNTTTLTWIPGGEESAWLVQFKPASEGDDAWTSINVNLLPMTTFGGLVGNTDYDVRVKAMCDPENEENQSVWVSTSFHSGCAAFELPFAEEFTTNTMPTCWENADFYFSSSSYAYSYTNGAELITPAINIPAENPTYLSFVVRGAGEYTVLASYRGTRADRFEEIYTGVAPNENTNVIVALNDLYKGRAVNFKIVNNSTSYQYFYNVNVNQCPFEATSLTVTDFTGTTVDLAWETNADFENFEIQYGEQGFVLGEGTSVAVNDTTATVISYLNYETAYDFYVRVVCEGDNGAWFGPVTATTAPSCSDPTITEYEFNNGSLMVYWTPGEWGTPSQYNVRYKGDNDEEYNYTTVIPVDMLGYTPFVTISGLASNAHYEFGVQSHCGENMESNWVSMELTTPCLPLAIPYAQNFEGDVFPPECWSQSVIEGSNEWYVYDGTAIYSYSPNNEALLITPAFDLSAYASTGVKLSFTHAQPDYQSVNDDLSVYYRTSASGSWVLLQAYTDPISSMVLEEIALPAAALTSYCQFAFDAAPNDGNNIYLDDFSIEEAPACGTPSITVAGLNATITPNSVFGTPTAYELMIGGETKTVTSTTVDLHTEFPSLELNTAYQISVRTICSGNETSEWYGPVDFTTPACWESCTYVVNMEDSYGDGWNGNAIYVMVDGELQESITLTSGSTGTANVIVCSGAVSFVWHEGSYPDETSFTIENEAGTTVYSCADGSTLSEGDNLYSIYCGTLPTCGVPSVNVSGTTVTLTPNAYATVTPNAYEITIEGQTQIVTDLTFDVTSLFTTLPSDATYQMSVRAICGEGDTSEVVTAEVNLPFTCQGTIAPYAVGTGTTTNSYLPSYSLYNYSLTQQLYTADEIGVPEGGHIYSLSFDITGAKERNIDIYIGTTTASSLSSWITDANFTKVYSGTAFATTGVNEFNFTSQIAYNGTDNIVVMVDDNTGTWVSGLNAKSHTGATNKAKYVYSDGTNYSVTSISSYSGTTTSTRNNIVFNICPNPVACATPKNIAVGNVTETTAEVSWTAGGSETEWEVSYTIGDQTTTVTTSDNPYTITGLSASTVYNFDFSIKSLCSATEESAVVTKTLSFNTVCGVAAVPYEENFDAYTSTTTQSTMVMPLCWNKQYTGTSTSYGAGIYNSSSYAVSGTNSLRLYNTCTTSTSTVYGDVYAVLPQLDAAINELMISFDAKPSTTTSYNSFFEVGVITDVEATDYNSVFQPIGTAHIVPAGGQSFTILLSDYTGADGNIAFRVTKTRPSVESRTGYYTHVYMDNLKVERIPTCFVPTSLTVSEVTDQSAEVSWTDNYDQSSYALEYRADNENGWHTVNVDTTYYLLNNLLASTEYHVRVKAVCGTDDESEYADEIGFITRCIAGADVEIAGTGSNQNFIPVGNYYNYSYTQQILTAGEINAVGTISSISFEYASATATTHKNNVNIYMANTDKSEFESASDWITEGLQLVYEGNLNCSEGWNEFALNTPFAYAGGNLVVVVEDNSGSYDGSAYNFKTTNTTNYSALTWQQDAAAYSGQDGTRRLYHSNVRLTICPEATDLAITDLNDFAFSCDIEDAVTISVKNLGYEGTISTFEAYYQVNDETPVHETVTLATPIAMNETAEYTFNQRPIFAAGANFIVAWVEMEGDLVDVNNTIASTPIVVLEPATVPYVENFTGLVINEGWNPTDANNDGITMNLNNDINYTFNDEAAADDWMMSPCIEMAAGTYTIIYDYKANSSLTEAFEVYYGNGAHITDMTNAVATHSFNNTDYETATSTITIAADGIYNFGFHATSLAGNLGFSIDNFKVYPVNDVVVTYAENGTVTPNGTIAVNYGEDLTLNLVPDPMYHVAGVWVDDVQVVPEDGTGANFMLYTLENVTEPHTVFVDFKLEFHIFKSVENYRSDLYSDLGGAFVPAATDTTIDPTPFTVNMVADPHYFLAGLTISPMVPDMEEDVFADVVNNGDGTYSYTIDTLVVANYYLNATFRRDTVAINYNVLTGKGYANDSELMTAGDTYTTWVDYSVNNDVDTTIAFYADENDGYHIVDVIVNGESQGRVDSYTFENVTETQNVDLKFGYRIDAFVSNYNTYDSITDIMGTIIPDTQYVAEYDPMMVIGTVEEHFHLYQFLVNGENRIDEVVFGSDPHYYYFTMDSIAENYTIEAVVKVDTFAITYNVNAGQGYADASDLLVEGDSYSTIMNYGDNWYSNIEPATGYSIANVTLDGQNLYTANNYQFNYIVESHVFDVTFAANTYTVTTNAYGNGTVSDGISFTYDPENAVDYVFTATAAEGYHITSVVINNEEMEITDPEIFIDTIENVADNYVINAHFAINTYTMTAEAGIGGTITPNGTQVVNYGSNVTYEINADEGWYILSTVIDTITTNYNQDSARTTLTVSFNNIEADHNVSVTFLKFMYNITAVAHGYGSINGGVDSIGINLTYGSNYTMTFDADENNQVADVVIDGVSMGAITSYEFINITANHNVVVTFEPIMYTLTATSNIEACTITPATTTVQAGDSVVYTLTIANGYDLDGVIANGQEVDVNINTNSFTIRNIQSDYTIFAHFIPENVTVAVSDTIAHATITPGTQTYPYGATPSYMIVPEMGYEILSVKVVNETAVEAIVNVIYNNGIGTFTLDTLKQDVTLTATVVKKQYTITVIAPEHGTITPGDTTVEYGAMVVYTITPDDYYTISDVKVDGSSRGQLSSYTFYNVTSNHTITAEFVPMPCDLMAENLTASNITLTTAHLTWSGDAQWYDVQYKTVDATSYSVAASKTSDDTLTLTDLQYNTLYIWRVRAYCDSANDIASDWVVGTFTTLDCNMPANLNAVVDSITAILTWEGSAESYVLRYRVVGEANYTIIDNIDENTYTLDDLTLNVQYEWGVKSICAEDIESEWAESTFSTVQTGIANADMSSIKVYSFQNNVYIVNEEGIAISNVDIYDIYGKQVYTGKVLSSPEVISLSVANGNYVVRLATENGVGVYKVAIVR